MRRATCHPNEPNHAKGLCNMCYMRLLRGSTGPRDPDAGIVMDPPIPPRILGLEMRCFTTTVGATCGKCGRVSSLRMDGDREMHCAGVLGGCGWTGYRVSTDVIDLRAALVERARGSYAPRLKGQAVYSSA